MYIPRKLEYQTKNNDGELITVTIEDTQLLEIAKSQPVVVLADAGMGKTLLMERVKNISPNEIESLTASELVKKSIKRLRIDPDKVLLIDAFDEIPSATDTSSIDRVLNKLAELDYPKFILTCRSIEWESSNKSEIESDYTNILTVNLARFTREDAQEFLQNRGLILESTIEIIEKLDENYLASYYENPRNLALLVEIDFSKNPIPKTKAKLFELATEKLWQEVNPQANNALGKLEKEQIIDCAGFLFAIYLLTGKQYFSRGLVGNTIDEALNIHSLNTLIDKEIIEATIKSRLFHSVGKGLFKPWHRSIAEYLGARWLAKAMSNPRVKRQILAYLVFDNGVIASLRGLFAWLPTFNPNLSEVIINTDPYGLIEYGDTSYFSDNDSKLLFDALEDLAVKNPWFRKNNNCKDAKALGLVNYSLIDRYKELLRSNNANFHFLTTILDVLKDADFIGKLENELFGIAYDDERVYSPRFDAFMLLHDKGLIKGSCDFDPLIESGSESSLRLIFEYAGRYGFDLLKDEQVISAVRKSYTFKKGVKRSNRRLNFNSANRLHFKYYPVSRIILLLENIIKMISDLDIDRYGFNTEAIRDINGLIIEFLQRYIKETKQRVDPLVFYKSITLFHKFYVPSFESSAEVFSEYFKNYTDEKIKVLKYLMEKSKISDLYQFNHSPLSSLKPSEEDLLELIGYIQRKSVTESNINKWKSLINIYSGREVISDELYQYTIDYAKQNNLLNYLDSKKEKIVYDWEIEQLRDSQRDKLETKIRHQKARNDLYPYINEIEKGNPHFCDYPAHILLNEYYEIPKDLKDIEKIKYILKDTLTESAIKGFEASLHSPAPKINHMTQIYDPIEPVLIAGIYCRLLRNESFNDLSDETILACSIILDFKSNFGYILFDANQPDLSLSEVLKREVIKRGLKKRIINEAFIPQFTIDESHINGIHWVYGEKIDELSIDTIVYLLNSYPKMQQKIQNRFIDTLINNDQLIRIDNLIKTNAESIILNENNYLDNVRWLALLSLLSENRFYTYLRCFEYPNLVFWQLKETYQETYLTKNPKMSLFLASWIVYRFSYIFPNIERPSGVSSGSRNDWQASEFIVFCLYQVSGITTFEAQNELQKLKSYIHPSYQALATNLLFEQSTRLREANYQPPRLADVLNILQNKAPENCKDLKTLILTLLDEIQAKVKASELDSYKMFYEDGKSKEPKKPHGENYCRDRLADLLKPYIESYNLRLDTEKDMPNDKRADLVCNSSKIQLPIEVKGQWHDDLWTAMNNQLGDLYLKEYQSQEQGIYLIFYFGNNSTKSLKASKDYKPQTASELQESLTACINDKYKDGIDVFVFDLSV